MRLLRSFRGRIFTALLVTALVPVAVAVAAGLFTVREIGSTVGTLGPWDAVAASGSRLVDEAARAAPGDSALAAAAAAHERALSESLRRSRLWSFVAERTLAILPVLALLGGALAGLVAFLAAGWLAAGFSRPVRELVGWTERIAGGEPLPSPGAGELRGATELQTLRSAFREMAAGLEAARDEEVRSARLRAWTEMARRVAHELKNPLTPMRMAATTLARRDDPGDADTGRILLEEIGRLDEMARTFAQFGRMPESPPSDVDLGELITGLVARHGEPGVEIEVHVADDAPLVRGHYDLLERSFRNLLVNALEAVAQGEVTATPAVRVSVERTHGGARVRVRDRGPGIPESLIGSVWMPDVTTKRQGTGLGLAIVKQAMDAHDGTAEAHNLEEEGWGCEFEVVLPEGPGRHPEDG
jgi:two-component system nitrogen regulation sensor histidine kinase NtrY